MTLTVVAACFAVLAACCFAGAVALQHGAVRATGTGEYLGVRALARAIRSRRWLAGSGLAVTGTALHVTALSLAPLVIVQPIGVLSLVLTVVLGARARGLAVAPRVRTAMIAVCGGVGGFVVLASLSGTVGGTVGGASAADLARSGSAQLVVVGAVVLAAVGMRARGRARSLVTAAAAAVLFGTGSALTRAASVGVIGSHDIAAGVGLAAESGLLMLVGGWLLHQAYAAGPPALVIAATTVIDPLTAVAIGLGAYREAAGVGPALAAAQLALAAVAIGAVIVLARSVPDPRPISQGERHVQDRPRAAHPDRRRHVPT
ncbi:hypothetical protein [Actinophytocola sp.]|uniref:hypothetical protein n=1 Tax=Actinophytocola sp. TaxID=1872138 RepID=UPI002EDB129D